MKDLAKHATIFGISNMLRQGLGVLLLPVYLTLIPPEQYGILSMLMIASNLISLMTSSTLAPALFRSYYDYEDREGQKTVVSTALVFTFFLSVVLIGLASQFTGQISYLLTGESLYSNLTILVLISAGARAINTVCLTVYRVKKWSKKYAVLSLVTMISSLLTIIFLVVVRKMGIEGIVIGNLVGAVIGTSLSLYFIRNELCFRVSLTETKKMYLYGYPHIPENFAAFAMNAGTRIILRTVTGSEGVGIFALGYRIGSVLEKMIINPLNMIAPASIMSVEKEQNPQRYYSALARHYFIVTGFAALILSLMTRPFLLIFSKQGYFDAWKVVPFIAMAIIAYGGRGLVSVGLMLKRKTIWYPIAYILGTLTALGLMVLLTVKAGPPGAAVSILVGNMIVCYIRNRASKRYMYVKLPLRSILTAYSVYIVIGLAGSLLSVGNPFFDGMIILAAAFALVPFLLVKLNALSAAELQSLKNLIGRKLTGVFGVLKQVFSSEQKDQAE